MLRRSTHTRSSGPGASGPGPSGPGPCGRRAGLRGLRSLALAAGAALAAAVGSPGSDGSAPSVGPLSLAAAAGPAHLAAASLPVQAPGDRDARPGRSDSGQELGVVDFRVSCSSEVAADFDRAVALLHHMMYQEARGAFEAIAAAEPDCAMAHWGMAATLFQPLWPSRPDVEDRRRGWELVQRARELGPGSSREEALLGAVEAFFQDPDVDEWWPRIERWAAALERAHQAHPDDLEIGAFHGLGILAAGTQAEDQLAENARAARILERVHQAEPLHPGAIHYIIHADDATGRAREHLHVVETYGEIAPHVAHALHMPSHVYVRLGDWPQVIRWNRASADAALEGSPEEWISFHYVHALDYLLYGYLQQANDEAAARVLDEALSAGPHEEHFGSAFHLAIMPARWAVERNAWDEAAALRPGEPDYLAWERYPWPVGVSWFARGLGAVHSGDLEGAREAESRLAELRDRARQADERAFATYIEVDRLILDAWIAFVRVDAAGAVARMEEAVRLEGTVEKHPITPGALVPPREALGDLLMELGRSAQALDAYESAMEVWPGRYYTVLGAARAAQESGDDDRARIHYQALLELVDDAAADRPGVEEARSFLAGGP